MGGCHEVGCSYVVYISHCSTTNGVTILFKLDAFVAVHTTHFYFQSFMDDFSRSCSGWTDIALPLLLLCCVLCDCYECECECEQNVTRSIDSYKVCT